MKEEGRKEGRKKKRLVAASVFALCLCGVLAPNYCAVFVSPSFFVPAMTISLFFLHASPINDSSSLID